MNATKGMSGHQFAEVGAQKLALRNACIDRKHVELWPIEMVDGRLTFRVKLEFGQTACWKRFNLMALYTKLFARRLVGFAFEDGKLRSEPMLAKRGPAGKFAGMMIAGYAVMRKGA